MKSLDKKHIFGMAKVGAKGQIVIPKEARDIFNIKEGDSLLVTGDEESGIAIFTTEKAHIIFKNFFDGEK